MQEYVAEYRQVDNYQGSFFTPTLSSTPYENTVLK